MESDVVTMQDIFLAKPVEDTEETAHAQPPARPVASRSGIKPQFLHKLSSNGVKLPNEFFQAWSRSAAPSPRRSAARPPDAEGARSSPPRALAVAAPTAGAAVSVRGLDTTRLPLGAGPTGGGRLLDARQAARLRRHGERQPGRRGHRRRPLRRLGDRARHRRLGLHEGRPDQGGARRGLPVPGQREAERPGLDRHLRPHRPGRPAAHGRHRRARATILVDHHLDYTPGHGIERRRLARREGAGHGPARLAARSDRDLTDGVDLLLLVPLPTATEQAVDDQVADALYCPALEVTC